MLFFGAICAIKPAIKYPFRDIPESVTLHTHLANAFLGLSLGTGFRVMAGLTDGVDVSDGIGLALVALGQVATRSLSNSLLSECTTPESVERLKLSLYGDRRKYFTAFCASVVAGVIAQETLVYLTS